MQPPLCRALALSLVAASSAYAGDSYLQLDRELNALAAIPQNGGDQNVRVGALLRTYFDSADSDLSATADDVEGFRMYDAQLWFSARVGAYDVFVKGNFADTTAFPPIASDGITPFTLRDAWARTNLTDEIQLYFGQFKCPAAASANVGDGLLAMIDRTRIGELFAFPGAYQPGVAVTGDWNQFHVKVAVQNGADGIADGNGIVVRGEYRIGEGAKQREGALGAEGLDATFGLGYFKDDSDIAGDDFGRAIVADMYLTYDKFSWQAEILDADEEFASRALGNTTDDAMPWDTTVGYLFGDDRWEAFARYQDLDNEADATIFGGGVNHYVSGHSTKWQANVSRYDDDAVDGTIVQVGLSLGLSEPN